METLPDGDQQRLRARPSERFAGQSHRFDLAEVLRILRAEPHSTERGHRQITIFHRPPVTQVVFAFEPGAELLEHVARGLVTIHGLEGRIVVEAAGQEYELHAGSLLVLNPGLPHSVRALEVSAMLLTVTMEGE